MIRVVLTDVLLVGLEWKGLRCHRRASPRPEETTPNIQIENIEKYKEKDKQHHENRTSKIQEHQKNKDRYNEKTLRIEKKTEKQCGKHKERDSKERKIELIPKSRERRKQKNKKQLRINQK